MRSISKGDTAADLVWLGVIVLLGLAVRLYLLVSSGFGIESDEAIVGLMAKHITEGREWPVFYYGQDYMGSLEAFIAAGFFVLLGRSGAVLKLVPLLFSLVHIALVYALARQFVGRWCARGAALLAALGPSALILWSIKARGGFIELVVLGSLSLLLAVKLLRTSEVAPRRLFSLGLILGLGWWVNNQIVFYVVPIAIVLALHFSRCWRLIDWVQGVLIGLLGLFLGSLPFWYANVFHSPKWATFEVLFGKTAGADTLAHLQGFFTKALPIILGARRFWSDSNVFSNASLLVSAVYLIVFVSFLIRRDEADSKSGSCSQGAELALLLTFCGVVPLIFSVSSFGWLSKAPRYLLPLYSVLFVLVGIGVSRLWYAPFRVGRVLASGIFLLLLSVHFASNYWGGVGIPGQPIVFRGQRVADDHHALYDFLRAHNYTHIHTNYWIGYRAAFETGEEITFSRFGRPRSLRIPEYEQELRDVDQGEVYVLVEAEAAMLSRQLRQFGYVFRSSRVGDYVVIDQLSRQRVRGEMIQVNEEQISASSRQGWVPKMLDGDLSTRWGSGMPQHPGMTVEISFARPQVISGIDIDLGQFVSDAPRHLIIEGKDRNQHFQRLFDLSGTKIFLDLREQEFGEIPRNWRITFQPTEVTSLRMVQQGSTEVFDWSIAELELYGVPPAR